MPKTTDRRPFARATMMTGLLLLVLLLAAGTAQAYPGQKFVDSPTRKCTSTVTAMAGVMGTCMKIPHPIGKGACMVVAYGLTAAMCNMDTPKPLRSSSGWDVGYVRHRA